MEKPNPKPAYKMNAYVIMLHLRSQGWTSMAEIWKLLGWDQFYQMEAQRSYGHINAMIKYLSKKWDEDIPRINAFIFKDGTKTKGTECTDYICKEAFGKVGDSDQPRPKEIAEYAAKIAAYPKWDKIVEILRREAFDAAK